MGIGVWCMEVGSVCRSISQSTAGVKTLDILAIVDAHNHPLLPSSSLLSFASHLLQWTPCQSFGVSKTKPVESEHPSSNSTTPFSPPHHALNTKREARRLRHKLSHSGSLDPHSDFLSCPLYLTNKYFPSPPLNISTLGPLLAL
jgi:hypothetical protein